jgi:hypothetical protein
VNIDSFLVSIYEYYHTDSMRLVGLITWIIAWRAAYLLSKNSAHALKAHLLYTVSNCLLLSFNIYYEHFEMAAMAFTFLTTSLKGCFNYWPRPVKEAS